MKAAIYCRVDGGGNPEMRQDALELQKWELEHYALAKGLQISGYYVDDGFSGHDLNRPELTKMLKDYDAGLFEQVLVVNRSRLYRGNPASEPRWPFRVRSMKQLDYMLER